MGWMAVRNWRQSALDERRARLGSAFVPPLGPPAEPRF